MSRVFVVQRPSFYCKTRKGWVNKYDLSPAEEFGQLIFLLRPGNLYLPKLQGAINHLQNELCDYTPDDHILLLGDPVAIGLTVMVASGVTGGKVSLLKYDRIEKRYNPYAVDIS